MTEFATNCEFLLAGDENTFYFERG